MTLRLGAKRIPARGPLPVVVTNTNRFAVSGRLSGATPARPGGIALATRSIRVRAAAKATVKLALPKRAAPATRHTGRLDVRLRAGVRDPAGHTRTVTKTVSVRLRRGGTDEGDVQARGHRGDEVAGVALCAPALASAAVTIGGDIAAQGELTPCGGAPACEFAQIALAGGQTTAPFDGVVVRWRVNGSTGPLALRVVRPAGPAYTFVSTSFPQRRRAPA